MMRAASQILDIPCRQPGCGCAGHSFAWASASRRMVYYETPRCASSSIKAALGVPGYAPAGRDSDFRLLTLDERAQVDPSWRSFAVVRDPWERLHSAWRLFCRGGNSYRRAHAMALFERDPASIDFALFVRLSAERVNHHWAALSCFLPQDASGRILVGAICRFERLAEGLMAAGLDGPLPHLNATEDSGWRADYTPELVEAVGARFGDDAARFGYRWSAAPGDMPGPLAGRMPLATLAPPPDRQGGGPLPERWQSG